MRASKPSVEDEATLPVTLPVASSQSAIEQPNREAPKRIQRAQLILLAFVCFIEPCGALSPLPPPAILLVLYERTGGAAWNVNTGWDGTTPACQWHGVTCDGGGNVVAVGLKENGLNGTVPSELGLLGSLRNLSLGTGSEAHWWDGSQRPKTLGWLSGTLPSQLAQLQVLRWIDR